MQILIALQNGIFHLKQACGRLFSDVKWMVQYSTELQTTEWYTEITSINIGFENLV
jgi:hypothetical protein